MTNSAPSITPPNLVALDQTMYAQVGRTPKFGSAGATPPWDAGGGWPSKNKPPTSTLCVLPGRIWSFYVEGCKHRYRESKKLGTPWLRRNGKGAWLIPRNTSSIAEPSRSAYLNDVVINRREPQNWGAPGLRPFGPPPYVLLHQIWSLCFKQCTQK